MASFFFIPDFRQEFWLYNFFMGIYDVTMQDNEKSKKMSGFHEICSVLCEIRDADQMRSFLEEIHTPAECKDLSLRWDLMKMLASGVPQRQIARELGISLCKITRGAKILKQDDSVSKYYLIAGEKDESKNPTG